ncbi:hypothetical protein [Bacterioplanoides sp.]|uniref:hypothetical protein n=1 Tax=Bacterioplanoides sp. TaxID=2066072 RepID=UPI003B0039C3
MDKPQMPKPLSVTTLSGSPSITAPGNFLTNLVRDSRRTLSGSPIAAAMSGVGSVPESELSAADRLSADAIAEPVVEPGFQKQSIYQENSHVEGGAGHNDADGLHQSAATPVGMSGREFESGVGDDSNDISTDRDWNPGEAEVTSKSDQSLSPLSKSPLAKDLLSTDRHLSDAETGVEAGAEKRNDSYVGLPDDRAHQNSPVQSPESGLVTKPPLGAPYKPGQESDQKTATADFFDEPSDGGSDSDQMETAQAGSEPTILAETTKVRSENVEASLLKSDADAGYEAGYKSIAEGKPVYDDSNFINVNKYNDLNKIADPKYKEVLPSESTGKYLNSSAQHKPEPVAALSISSAPSAPAEPSLQQPLAKSSASYVPDREAKVPNKVQAPETAQAARTQSQLAGSLAITEPLGQPLKPADSHTGQAKSVDTIPVNNWPDSERDNVKSSPAALASKPIIKPAAKQSDDVGSQLATAVTTVGKQGVKPETKPLLKPADKSVPSVSIGEVEVIIRAAETDQSNTPNTQPSSRLTGLAEAAVSRYYLRRLS